MSDLKKHSWLSSVFVGTTEKATAPNRYLPLAFLLLGVCLLAAAAGRSPWMAEDRARLAVKWRFDRGDYAYLLRGRYTIASVSGGFVTSIANDAGSGASGSSIDVPMGLYRVTLEPGYTLERFVASSVDAASGGLVGDSVEVVPASLVSPNPMVVMAKEGRIAPLHLSLVDMPGTRVEPAATCMHGS